MSLGVSLGVADAIVARYPRRAEEGLMSKLAAITAERERQLGLHRARIGHYVRSLVRDGGEAEDVLQEVMLRAHRSIGELRDEEALSSWLFRIATHACLDHLRRRVRRPSIAEGADPDAVEAPAEAPDGLQATLEQREMSECVQRFLVALPDDYRAVILLTELEGLTGPEISSLLGIPLTTVKMRLHRARRLLQEELEAGCSLGCDERGVVVCEPKGRGTGQPAGH
jgi:RNA polymerase sigma-70 factor, ECF subfamily